MPLSHGPDIAGAWAGMLSSAFFLDEFQQPKRHLMWHLNNVDTQRGHRGCEPSVVRTRHGSRKQEEASR